MRFVSLGALAAFATGCDCSGYRSSAEPAGDASADALLDASLDSWLETDAGDSRCRACATGDLEGVELCVEADRCSFEVGEGGTFDVVLRIERTAPIHVAGWGDPEMCSECFLPTEDPFSYVGFGIWSEDGSVRYCPACDVGCCSNFPPTEMILSRGEHFTSFEWPGVQWDGPSDTGNPYEGPFPPGSYMARVSFHGTDEGAVAVDLPIQVVE